MSSKRSEYGSLTDRVGRTPKPLPCHVWVDGAPGLLLEWRRTPDGAWSGRCVLVEDGRAVEAWLAARRISPTPPAGGPAPLGSSDQETSALPGAIQGAGVPPHVTCVTERGKLDEWSH